MMVLNQLFGGNLQNGTFPVVITIPSNA